MAYCKTLEYLQGRSLLASKRRLCCPWPGSGGDLPLPPGLHRQLRVLLARRQVQARRALTVSHFSLSFLEV